jgi:tRNA-2-methylthio-N6-dimethylallyladenosine synthase
MAGMTANPDQTASPKRYFVKSYGCQMNAYDGERMGELLGSSGMEAAGSVDEADLVLLNTCHIRERAVDKVYSEIGRMRREDGSSPMLAVAGCVAQAEGAEIGRRAREVDIVVGPQAYHRLPELIARAAKGERVIDTDMPLESKFDVLPKRQRQGPSAFLTVQEGCDKFCTYCVVPYTRGAEVSRPWAAVMDEARALIDAGAKEITLLGQNVNAWTGTDETGREQGLDGLIRALDRLDGLARIRYTTSHPMDMTEGLIRAHGDVEKLMPFLHLPVQSGSERILRAMNRSHDRDTYVRIIERARAVRPDIAVSGDFIVGFPGETDRDFEDSLQIIRDVDYAMAFSFKYSPRPGTPAATMGDQIADEVMTERLRLLQELLNVQQHRFNQTTLGRRIPILLERPGKKPGQKIGKSPWLQSVVVDTDLPVGALVEVDITSAGPNSLGATLAMEEAA